MISPQLFKKEIFKKSWKMCLLDLLIVTYNFFVRKISKHYDVTIFLRFYFVKKHKIVVRLSQKYFRPDGHGYSIQTCTVKNLVDINPAISGFGSSG